MHERYSIEVDDETVEIYGELTIEEAFDFLSFFERKGYKSLVLGSENSTLRMMKRDQAEVIEKQHIIDLKDEIHSYKSFFESEKKSHEQSKVKLKEVEKLLKDLMSEEYQKYRKLYDENQKLIRAQMIMQLDENPEVKKILDNFHIGCTPPGEEIKGCFDWTYTKNNISRPFTQEEKDGAFNQLLNMKKDCPDILPSIEQIIKDHKNDTST